MTAQNGCDLTEADEVWLARPVPRYTSYPPAPAFHDGVGSSDRTASLKALPSDVPVSLYVHVPFCKRLCLYCGCHTAVTNRTERVWSYLDALKAEAAHLARETGRRFAVRRVHFGGGTPNIMNEKQIGSLFKALRESFDLENCREIAVELDPRAVTRDQAAILSQARVNRASLGVQDFDAEVQQAIGREQPYDRVAEAVHDLRRVGIAAINFDLMYGLPKQTLASVERTAQQALALQPDRIALFSYAHVPQIKRHQQALESYGLPDKRTVVQMEHAARAVLTGAGYVEIGMDHFAKPDDALAAAVAKGYLRRNFQGYTDDNEVALIGLGASAIGSTPDGFFQNERDTEAYEASVLAGQLAVRRGILTTAEDRLRAQVIERLMCDMGVNLGALAAEAGQDPAVVFAEDLARLAPLVDAGIVGREGFSLRLLTPHRMAVRVMAHAFDRYAGRGAVASKAA